MAAIVTERGDSTSRECKPDFDGAKGDNWMKMISDSRQATGQAHNPLLPYKPRKGLAEHSYWTQVDRRLSRKSFSMGVTFQDGRLVREDNK